MEITGLLSTAVSAAAIPSAFSSSSFLSEPTQKRPCTDSAKERDAPSHSCPPEEIEIVSETVKPKPIMLMLVEAPVVVVKAAEGLMGPENTKRRTCCC